MDSDPGSSFERSDSAAALRKGVGAVVLAAGLVLCWWTFQRVLELLAGEEIRLVARLIPASRASRSILLEGQAVELPPVLFEFGAYGMAVGLLSVVATMANAMVRGGSGLLQPEIGRQLERLRRQVADALRKRDT